MQELIATGQEPMGSSLKELKEINRAEIEDKKRHNYDNHRKMFKIILFDCKNSVLYNFKSLNMKLFKPK